jgi:NDP-4-keto-2,6-dideoxyhexose 3-C-methyltransferase
VIVRISRCRVCGNADLVSVLNLGEQYLTGVFPRGVSEAPSRGPLELVKCHGDGVCGLLQLANSYDLDEMYGDNYGYRSGLNASMVAHLESSAQRIQQVADLDPRAIVLDIGSNDGTFLSFFPERCRRVGFDPTIVKFKDLYPADVQTVADFFSAARFREVYGDEKASVVTSFSMFYDLESPIDFVKEIASILDPVAGIWVFEQSYMPLMLERLAYDTVCHEHLEYYGLLQVKWILRAAGLQVIDVALNDTNGGSFVVTAAHTSSTAYSPSSSVSKIEKQELESELLGLTPFFEFRDRVELSRAELQETLRAILDDGLTIGGIGASTKGNVLLQYAGITPVEISAIGDVNPEKDGRQTPGTWIPICSEQALLATEPDYLLVLPWHFREFFMSSPAFAGRKLIFPLPQVEIVTP